MEQHLPAPARAEDRRGDQRSDDAEAGPKVRPDDTARLAAQADDERSAARLSPSARRPRCRAPRRIRKRPSRCRRMRALSPDYRNLPFGPKHLTASTLSPGIRVAETTLDRVLPSTATAGNVAQAAVVLCASQRVPPDASRARARRTSRDVPWDTSRVRARRRPQEGLGTEPGHPRGSEQSNPPGTSRAGGGNPFPSSMGRRSAVAGSDSTERQGVPMWDLEACCELM